MTTVIQPPQAAAPAPTRGPVPVTITSRPIADDEFRITPNIGEQTEDARCSCTASDDQVY